MKHLYSNRKRLYAVILTLLMLFSVSQSLVHKVNASGPPQPTNNNTGRKTTANRPTRGRGTVVKKTRGRGGKNVKGTRKPLSKSKSNAMKELEGNNVIEEAKKYEFSDEEEGYDESLLYSEGKKCLENRETRIKACAFLLRAADKNYIEAMSTLLINFYDFIEQSQKEHYLTSIFSVEEEKVISVEEKVIFELIHFLFSKDIDDIASYKDKIIVTIARFAERGDKEAYFLLGKIYFRLQSSDDDIEKSQNHLNTAIDGYNFRSEDIDRPGWLKECEEILLSIHLSENEKITPRYCSLFKYYRGDDITFDKKDISDRAYLFLGLVYFKGSEGVKIDFMKALQCCEEAAKRGVPGSHTMLALIYAGFYNEYPAALPWDKVKDLFKKEYEESTHIDRIQNFLELYALADKNNISTIFAFFEKEIPSSKKIRALKSLLKRATGEFGYEYMDPFIKKVREAFRYKYGHYDCLLGELYCDNTSEHKLDYDKAMSFFGHLFKSPCDFSDELDDYICEIRPGIERCALTKLENVEKLFESYKHLLSCVTFDKTKEKLWENLKSLLEKATNKFGYNAVSCMHKELVQLCTCKTPMMDTLYFLGKIYVEKADNDKLDLTKAITCFEHKYKSNPPDEVKAEIERLLNKCALTSTRSFNELLHFYEKVSRNPTTNNNQLFDVIKSLFIESTKKFGLFSDVTIDFYKFCCKTDFASNAESLLCELYRELLIKEEEINYTEAISYFKSMYRLDSITQEHRTAIENAIGYLTVKTNKIKDLFEFYSGMGHNTPDQTYKLLKRIFNKLASRRYDITSLCEMFHNSCHNKARTGYFLGKFFSKKAQYESAMKYFKEAYLNRPCSSNLAKIEDHLQECAFRLGDKAIHDLIAFYKKASAEGAIEKLMEYVVICRKDYMITNKFLEGVYDKQAIEYQKLTNKLLQKYVEQMIKSGDEYSQKGNIQDALEKYQIAANNGSILAMCKFIDLCNSVTRSLNKKINQTKSRFELNLNSLEEEQIWQVIRYYETKKDCIKTFIDYCSKLGSRGIDHAIEYIRQNYTSENIKDLEVLLTELKKISPKDEKVFAYLFEMLYSDSCSLIKEKKYSLAEHLLTFLTCDEMSEYNKKIPQCFLMLGEIYFDAAKGSQKTEDIQKALRVLNKAFRQAQILTDAEKYSVAVMLESLYKSARNTSGMISFYSDSLQGNFNEEIVSRAKEAFIKLVPRVKGIQSYLDVIKLRSCVKYCVDEDKYEQTIKDIDTILKEKVDQLIQESKIQDALSILKVIDEVGYHKLIISSEEIKDLELKKQSVKYIIKHDEVDPVIKNLCVEICINLAKSKLDQGGRREALKQYELAANMGSVVAKFEYSETVDQMKIVRPQNSFHRHAKKQSLKYQIELEQISDIQDLIEMAKLYQQRMQMSFNDDNFKKFVLYCIKSKSDGMSLLMTNLMEWFNDENHTEEMYDILSRHLLISNNMRYIKVTLKFLAFLDDKDHTSLQQKITQLLSKNFPKDSIKYSLLQRLSSNKDSLVESKVFEFWKNSIKHRKTPINIVLPEKPVRCICLSEWVKASERAPESSKRSSEAPTRTQKRRNKAPTRTQEWMEIERVPNRRVIEDCFTVSVGPRTWTADFHGKTVQEAEKLFNQINDIAVRNGVEKVNYLTGRGIHSRNGRANIRDHLLALSHCNGEIKEPYAEIMEKNEGVLTVWVEKFKESPHNKN